MPELPSHAIAALDAITSNIMTVNAAMISVAFQCFIVFFPHVRVRYSARDGAVDTQRSASYDGTATGLHLRPVVASGWGVAGWVCNLAVATYPRQHLTRSRRTLHDECCGT